MENQDIAWSEFIGFWKHGYIPQGQDQNDAWSLRKRRYTAPSGHTGINLMGLCS